ncbi:acyl-CoA dehydrogenase family protein [Nocardioides humi]|uniref:acyl-CoA dehydrogenase family protein n=1 Tax=Nocardioides humi TaxID=449461 RepID=UPI0015E874D4|nr:acyl-CoA dehydrogenase family protein [Nocardioides humi]
MAADLGRSLADGASQRDALHATPVAEAQALRRSGLLATTVPARFGGPDAGYGVLAEVIRHLALGDPSVAQVPQSHFGLIEVLHSHGTEEQRAWCFDQILAGKLFSNAQTERGLLPGQPLGVTMRRRGDELVLQGTKNYCTGSTVADWIRISARDEQGEVVFALVPVDAPGLEVIDDWAAIGQRGTGSGTVRLTGAVVDPFLVLRQNGPEDRLLGTSFQLMHAAIDVGIARAALDEGLAYVRDSARPYVDALARGWERADEEPHIVLRAGELSARVHAAEALLARAGRLLDVARAAAVDRSHADEAAAAVAEVRAFGADAAVDVASDIFAFAGASAAATRINLDRHWRNARTHTLHDPTRWKYHHAGAYALTRTPPPAHGQS